MIKTILYYFKRRRLLRELDLLTELAGQIRIGRRILPGSDEADDYIREENQRCFNILEKVIQNKYKELRELY